MGQIRNENHSRNSRNRRTRTRLNAKQIEARARRLFSKKLKLRLFFVLSVFFISFCFLSGRIYYYKIVKGEEYEKNARMQHVSHTGTIIPANRGSILDRNRQSLAVSTTVYNVIIDPIVLSKHKEEEQRRTVATLSRLLGISANEVEIYLGQDGTGNLNYDKHYYKIAHKISSVLAEEIKKEKLSGIFLEQDSIRTYVHDSLASHLIGFLRYNNRWGLEYYYDKELKGVPGRSLIAFNENNTISQQLLEPVSGYSLVTTIDQSIQQFAEEAVRYATLTHTPRNAAVIVMKPNTGEVLAMASSPTFDLNDPMSPILSPGATLYGQWEHFDEAERIDKINQIWQNYNVSSTFEPGSIFKPILVAAALEENIIGAKEGFGCEGVRRLYDRDIGCWNRYGHGFLSVEDTLAQSCNLAMVTIAARMGPELFYKYQRDFGFGEKTDIDLPLEVSASHLMYTPDKLKPVELATASFGQTFNCTPLQILNAFCAVINGGNLMRPYVVSQVIDNSGKVISETTPYVHRKVISQETSDVVRGYLRSVFDSPAGTGKKAKIEGYAIGGKTGTAEQDMRGSNNYALSFIGFLPVDDPQIIAIAVIDRPPNYSEDLSGSSSAGPMLKGLFENIITYMNIQPTFDYSEEHRQSEVIISVSDYTDMSLVDAARIIINSGLDYELIGAGNIVTNQTIKAGTEVEPDSVVTLYLTKNDDNVAETVRVPNIIGLSFDEALTRIIDAGLVPISESGESGTVVSQSVRAGYQIEVNSELILTLE